MRTVLQGYKTVSNHGNSQSVNNVFWVLTIEMSCFEECTLTEWNKEISFSVHDVFQK